MILIIVLLFQLTYCQVEEQKPLSFIKSQEHIQYMSLLKSKAVGYTKAQITEIGATSITHYVMYLSNSDSPIKRVLVIVGQEPSNPSFQNGYYGLASARQLKQRKFEVEVVLLFQNDALRSRLAQQCKTLGIKLHFNILQKLQDQHKTQLTKSILVEWLDQYDLIIDAISSQTMELIQPVREFVHAFQEVHKKILSIDLPSGWNANEGNINDLFHPKYLISIAVPLKGTENYVGKHALGGRLLTGNFTLPKYRPDEEYVIIKN